MKADFTKISALSGVGTNAPNKMAEGRWGDACVLEEDVSCSLCADQLKHSVILQTLQTGLFCVIYLYCS